MEFNPFSPEFKSNPYAIYAEMRAEGAVHHAKALNAYIVSRYDEVVHVLKNPAVFSSAGGINIEVRGEGRTTVINSDPPAHTDLRNLVSRAFTPRMVADMEPRIREITGELIDRAAPSGEIDLVADLAIPLPVTVIAEIMGIEPDRRDDFKRWSTSAISGDPMTTEEERQRIVRDTDELTEYFENVVAARRKEPRADLISAFVRAESGEHPVAAGDVVAFCILLLIAGNETTTNLIGNAVLALLQHPEEMARVLADASLIPNLVEEALRYDSPVQVLPRRATRAVELGGVTIPEGAEVYPSFGSANRDERRFPEADRFDVMRNTQGHVAFGHGIHFCLGAPLARLEARVALEQALARLPALAFASDAPLERVRSPLMRGLQRLPLRFAAVTPAGAA